MHHWTKHLFAIAALLLLTGCLWGPGKFSSDLTLRKDGSFLLDYRGEIVLQLPPDAVPTRGRITRRSAGDAGKERPCTKAEIAEQKDAYDKKRKDSEGMAKMFGLPGLDDKSNRAFAAKLTKYAGWRSVTYRGKGVFDVDYHFAGRATQDFLFPALPDNDLIDPLHRDPPQGGWSGTASPHPEFTGGAGPLGARAGAAASEGMGKGGPVSRAQGRFTVITDGEILTNNSEDGAAAHAIGRQLHWDVGPSSNKIPETLIRL